MGASPEQSMSGDLDMPSVERQRQLDELLGQAKGELIGLAASIEGAERSVAAGREELKRAAESMNFVASTPGQSALDLPPEYTERGAQLGAFEARDVIAAGAALTQMGEAYAAQIAK